MACFGQQVAGAIPKIDFSFYIPEVAARLMSLRCDGAERVVEELCLHCAEMYVDWYSQLRPQVAVGPHRPTKLVVERR